MLITFLAIFAVFSARAHESPEAPRQGRHKLQAELSYFQTDGNFADDGAREGLLNGGSLQGFLTDFSYAYDLAPDWRLFAGFNVAMNESSDGTFTRSNSGLDEAYVGAQKWYDVGRLEWAPEVVATLSFVETDMASGDEVLLGDGANRGRVGAWVLAPMKGYRPYGYLGFEYRDHGLSARLPYEGGIKVYLGDWWAQGAVRGVQSVIDDDDAGNALPRDLYLQIVDGGSFKYYSVNPSYTEVAVDAGWRSGAWGAYAGAAMTVLGTSAADGFTVSAGVSYAFGGAAKRGGGEPAFERDEPLPPSEEFNIKGEKYDHSLFEGDSKTSVPEDGYAPPEPPPAAPKAGKPTKPVDVQVELRPVKKKRKKKPAKSLDKMLNDAEKSLER